MADVSLALLVLKTRQMDRLLAFYQEVGIQFNEEQHGKGPRHHAGRVGDVVIEIYPLPNDGIRDTSTRLGFSVDNLAEVVLALQAIGTQVVKQPTHTAWGLQAVVKDPDGRSVELAQGEPSRGK
jgi:predicted enzyme related to lactoylglutathione lyase